VLNFGSKVILAVILSVLLKFVNMKSLLSLSIFLLSALISFSQERSNKSEKRQANPIGMQNDSSTIVILNNKIFNLNDSLVQTVLRNDLNKNNTQFKVINDENSKTIIKHVLIISTNSTNN
jgi:hypothetical protein